MKHIFLTGASAGIGRLAALDLCRRGHEVWGTGRTLQKLPSHARFHPVVLDLNDPESLAAAFSRASVEAQWFDVLINNAGAGVFGALEAFSAPELTAQFETLLLGPLRLIQLALPQMRARRAGVLINVSSLAGQFPLPFMAPYSIGKAALSALSESLALELAHTGIRVVDVCPGDFATQFHESTRRIDASINAAYAPNIHRAWDAIDKNMKRARDPVAVSTLLVAIAEGRTLAPTPAVGSVFQSRIAPFLARIAPRRAMRWGLRIYYGLKA